QTDQSARTAARRRGQGNGRSGLGGRGKEELIVAKTITAPAPTKRQAVVKDAPPPAKRRASAEVAPAAASRRRAAVEAAPPPAKRRAAVLPASPPQPKRP